MSAQSIRLKKEARTLLWPWCAVMLLGAVNAFPSASRYDVARLSVLGFYVGIPLLAVLPFGSEFQHRTISLLLAQPVRRVEIWMEKMLVMFGGVLSVSLVYYVGWRPMLERSTPIWVFAAVFLFTTVTAAAAWTLIGRSTIGGMILTGAFSFVLITAGIELSEIAILRHQLQRDAFPILLEVFVIAVAYGLLMLWLGYRKFVRFEAAGELATRDLMRSLPGILPRPAAARGGKRIGAFWNIVRKEIHLLQPVWLLTLSWFAVLPCLAALQLLHLQASLNRIVFSAVAIYVILIAMLAGVVSMGEERQSGSHSWHLTLPISLFRQWSTKLALNLLVATACGLTVIGSTKLIPGAAFPAAIADVTQTSPFNSLLGAIWMLTVPAFWCACAVKGTIRAAGAVIPVLASLAAALSTATSIVRSHWIGGIIRSVALHTHAFPPSHQLKMLAFNIGWLWIVLLIALSLLALVQSYRLFRQERSENLASIVRPLLPLLAFVFLFSSVTTVMTFFVSGLLQEESRVAREVGQAVEALNLGPSTLEAAHPKTMTIDDLSRVFPLSDVTRVWLANARITVSPKPARPLRTFKNGKWQEPTAKFAANLYFRNGAECRIYDVRSLCKTPGEPFPEGLWESLY